MYFSNKVLNLMPDTRLPDAIDRKLLAALTENAERSYAELGALVGLSPPAVHERVKRYKASGRIARVAALLDPSQTGKGFLSFVHVDTTGWGKTQALMAFERFPEVEEIHSVTGDTCMLLKVRVASNMAMEALLAQLYALPEVVSTKSYVVLSTYLERPVQPGISEELTQTSPALSPDR
ncbi:MAG: Lrp/AsnC family transcriptional regulator [Pseudomonadota bacterium]